MKANMFLITLMALTRVHHFGDAFSLPDASLAVFFLAGLCCANHRFLGLLLVEAALLDYVAIHQFNVSDWCMSPAYVFLIPTYAVLWFAGRYCSRFKTAQWSELVYSLGLAVLATSAAFMISNGSFYLFSGRYANLPATQYAASVAQYYLPYMSSALIYTVLGLAVIKVAQLLPAVTMKTSA